MLWRVARKIAGQLLILALAGVPLTSAFSCNPSPSHSSVAGSCAINSDCNSPLSCAFGRCHNACKESRDCPAGERCEASGGGMGVCALPQEFTCSAASTCKQPGLVCASDQQCRTPCQTTTDCSMTGVKGLCVPMQAPGSGACFDPNEIDGAIDGGIPDAMPNDGTPGGDDGFEGDSMGDSGSDDGGGSATDADGAPDGSGSSKDDATVGGDGGGVGDGGGMLGDGGVEAGCPSSLTLCNGFCVNTMTDTFNCGMCGNTCVVKCAAGQCTNPVAITALSEHSCARLSDGTAKCWGQNDNGQIGNGSNGAASAPVAVLGSSGVIAIAAGGQHSCAALSDGTATCWGRNDSGQLGNGTKTASSTPVPVAGLSGVSAIAAGWDHSCAVVSGGGVQCWGNNGSGQLGDGATTNPDAGTLVTVSGLSGATAVFAGNGYSCALLSGRSVMCWGENTAGQNSKTPTAVPGLNGGATAVATGEEHACALISDGTVKCWGANGQGQLGNRTTTASMTAVVVSGLTGAISVAAADETWVHKGFSCAAVSGGTVQCWGDNSYAEFGDGTTGVPDGGTPTLVSGIASATAVVAGGGYVNDPNFACALLSDHSVKCWGGNNTGQLGNGTTMTSPTPVAVIW
jgi:alpha-tubulin suppressor-like RCC1 family protein